MISDVLSEAAHQIEYYLTEPVFQRTYTGDLYERIARLRDEMVAIRIDLDTPPVG